MNIAIQLMSTPLSSRKRKRGLSDVNQSDSLSIELSSLPDTQTGPVLGVCVVFFVRCPYPYLSDFVFYHIASFPYLTIPKNTPFSVSVREEDEGKEFVNCSSTIAGETDAVEFSGSANDGSDGAGSRCGFLSPQGDVVLILSRMQILPRTPSPGILETYSAAHASVPDFSTSQGPQKLSTY